MIATSLCPLIAEQRLKTFLWAIGESSVAQHFPLFISLFVLFIILMRDFFLACFTFNHINFSSLQLLRWKMLLLFCGWQNAKVLNSRYLHTYTRTQCLTHDLLRTTASSCELNFKTCDLLRNLHIHFISLHESRVKLQHNTLSLPSAMIKCTW